ncbi:MAG: serine/threonine-protein kinase, partial [Planctomycetota bacterium]
LLARNERVKLADFGIARLFGSTQLTTAGGILGTADYMSPEQADGKPVTARCDQYSLGCVMYALLAGRPPFRAKTLPEMLQLQRYAEPEPVRRYAPQAPQQLERAIAQLLAKTPAERFPNTLVLARHLEAMTLALSKPSSEDFRVSSVNGSSDEDVAALPINMAITQLEDSPAPDGGSNSVSIELAPDEPTLLPADEEADDIEPDTEDLAPKPSFTLVSGDEANTGRGGVWVPAAQAAATLLVVAALGYGAWRLFSPPDADTLYASIMEIDEQAWASGDDRARQLLKSFEERFPNDLRRASLEPKRQQLQLASLSRRLRAAMLRGEASASRLSADEQLYVRALRTARVDPTDAIAKLRALVDLLPDTREEGAAAETFQLRTLANQQIEQLQQATASDADSHRPFAEQRLAAAEAMHDTDPARAETICRALVQLYGDQPWARDIVRKAQAVIDSSRGAE